jgi:serine protease Do
MPPRADSSAQEQMLQPEKGLSMSTNHLRSPHSPAGRRRGALAAVGLAALGVLAAAPEAVAQLRSDSPGVQTPFGRAPLTFADIVEKVKPAVVSVSISNGGARVARNTKRPPGSGPELFPGIPDDHPLNELFKNLPKEFRNMPSPRPSQAQGSGFLISADGYLVTNNHVIDGGGKITVSFDQKNKHEAELVGADPRTDLALLKIKDATKPFPYVKFSAKESRVGDWVVAVGNPFGLGGTVTAGIVSALGRDIGSGPYDFLQIDAAVNRGNSGGPTFNLDGEVVGVNTAIYSPSGGNVGIAFAVPAKTATEVIAQLRSSGSVSRGWLGVKIQNVDDDTKESLGLAEARGALINEVTSGGPAASAGLKVQDTILQINGDKINDSRDLARKIADYAPNTQVDVKVLRQGKEQTVKVVLGRFPGSTAEIAKLEKGEAPAAKASSDTKVSALGLSVTAAKAAKAGGPAEGVQVSAVEESSDAAVKGLKAGDLILEINSQPVNSPAEIESTIKKWSEAGRKAVLLAVKSGEQKRIVPVQLKKG